MIRLALILLFAVTVVRAEIISADRRITWQGNVGISGGIPTVTTVFTNMLITATAAQINSAIGACPSNQVVQLAAGAYSFATDIDIDSPDHGVVLRGAGRDLTTITFTGGGAQVRIRGSGISDAALDVEANLSADATKGSSTLTLASVPAWVTVGQLIGIDQLDDATFVSDNSGVISIRQDQGNGDRGMTQLNMVTAKDATTITLETPLIATFQVAQTAQIYQPHYNPSTGVCIKRVGVEDMTLNSTQSGGGGQMVTFENAYNCWLKNVKITNMTGGYGVWPVFSYRLHGLHVWITKSHLYGAGNGYGWANWHASTHNLVENSIFHDLHNAMVCVTGASGNVFAYCAEFDGQSTANQHPSMNTHGVHTMMNLWEGNFTEGKLLTDWTHGSSSHNTLFRSRITGENGSGATDLVTCYSVEYYNRYWNAVYNSFGTIGKQNKLYQHSGSTAEGSQGSIFRLGGEININSDFTPSDAFSYTSGMFILLYKNRDTLTSTNSGVVLNGSPGQDIADETAPDSYYVASKPAWMHANYQWPANPLTFSQAITQSTVELFNPAVWEFYNGNENFPSSGSTAAVSISDVTIGGVKLQ